MIDFVMNTLMVALAFVAVGLSVPVLVREWRDLMREPADKLHPTADAQEDDTP